MSRAAETAKLLWEPRVGERVQFTSKRRKEISCMPDKGRAYCNLYKRDLVGLERGNILRFGTPDTWGHHAPLPDGFTYGMRIVYVEWTTGARWWFPLDDLEPVDE